MSGFDDLRTTRNGRSHGCPRCGAEKNAGSVSILLRQLGTKGQVQGGAQIATKTRSFCETCAVDVYREFLGTLEASPARETVA